MRHVWQTTCHFQGGLAQSQIKHIHLPYGVAGQHSDIILFKHIRGMMDLKTSMPSAHNNKMGHVFFCSSLDVHWQALCPLTRLVWPNQWQQINQF